jgi:hypothetical protein
MIRPHGVLIGVIELTSQDAGLVLGFFCCLVSLASSGIL